MLHGLLVIVSNLCVPHPTCLSYPHTYCTAYQTLHINSHALPQNGRSIRANKAWGGLCSLPLPLSDERLTDLNACMCLLLMRFKKMGEMIMMLQ